MMALFNFVRRLNDSFFGTVERLADGWFLGLAARFVFFAVLFFYYLNSASLKVGPGFAGFFEPSFGAYIQILSEQGLAAFDFDIANVPPHLKAVVYAGTYAEFLLPVLIVAGLFTRVAALGMIIFIAVQSFVDIRFHGVGEATVGGLFDRASDSLIADQRSLWIFLLLVLVVKGAGAISPDWILARKVQ